MRFSNTRLNAFKEAIALTTRPQSDTKRASDAYYMARASGVCDFHQFARASKHACILVAFAKTLAF